MKLADASSGTGRRVSHQAVQEGLYARIRFKVLIDIFQGLFPGDAQVLAEAEGADAVDDAEVHGLGVAPF